MKNNTEIQINTNTQELATAITDFVLNRPAMKFLRFTLQFSAVLVVSRTIYNYQHNIALTYLGIFNCLFAVIYFKYYRFIHFMLIRLIIKNQVASHNNLKIILEPKEINVENSISKKRYGQKWHKTRFIATNRYGYIIPLTGLARSGRFIWIPLNNLSDELNQELHKYIERHNIKLRSYE